MNWSKLCAWWVLMAFSASIVTPAILQAQDYDFALSAEDEAFVSDVRERLTLKDTLESQWESADQRRRRYEEELRRLEEARPPANTDPDNFYERVRRRMQQLRDGMQQNDSILNRTKGRLTKVYEDLKKDIRRVKDSQDPALRQEIGTQLGVAGMIAAPIWMRPTAGGVAAGARHAINVGRSASMGWRIPRYQNWAASAGQRAINAEAARAAIKPSRWVPQSNGASGAGAIHLREHVVNPDGTVGGFKPGSKAVRTRIPAKIKTADGTWVRNERGFIHANDLASLRNTRTVLQNNINKLRLEASRATNARIKTTLESRAAKLEGSKAKLDAEIANYRSQNPSFGSRMKQVGASAAKWAAFSVGITVATNTVQQLARNGWDVRKVDWGAATRQLKDPRFWGGTAGSFVGSYGASLIASALPGGPFVKVAMAVGGAALGWQVGSGNFGNTDWVGLGVGTLGATVGILIGSALGGPIGAFIGGIAGQLAADFILRKVRDWIIREESNQAATVDDLGRYASQEPPRFRPSDTYEGGSPADTGYPSGDIATGYGGASDIASERARVYEEMMELQLQMKSDPQAFQQFVEKQREYDRLSRELSAMQRGSDIRSQTR